MSVAAVPLAEGQYFTYEELYATCKENIRLQNRYEVLMAQIQELADLWAEDPIPQPKYRMVDYSEEDNDCLTEMAVYFYDNEFNSAGNGCLLDGACEATDAMILEIVKALHDVKKRRKKYGKLPKGITLPKESS